MYGTEEEVVGGSGVLVVKVEVRYGVVLEMVV